ncbi:MGH1-like glycoside hydrolase domain-containing protein [Candidatus Arthromitus sp. SFB-rat-Yit]|uniref:MGH1-like glycoside hydrolase domain-containing protein n=1 Tax=Candidatus Arthromitus sp. SFB-rat-Yit TaxID=1041504 RepID=UPI000227A506|nr:trehalase family glycosidase [Candidatus Arthromitus sp. SFB-rat-Yit]BAK81591.1 cell wall surface anchor family protein [Candidatus Arthromitus sp. SFB-rat-Yit]
MKWKFIKKLLSGFMIFSLCFSSSVYASGKKYEISDFVNVLNVQARLTDTPYGYYQVSDFTTFMDNGSWHGYSLPSLDDKNNLGGFAGPTILFESTSETIAVNLSEALTKIKLVKNGNEVDLSLAKPTLSYYPGKLVQSYEFRNDFKLIMELIFGTDRTAIVKTQIINLSNDPVKFNVSWEGKLFDSFTHNKKVYNINPSIESLSNGLRVNFDGENGGLSENTKYNKFLVNYDKDVSTEVSEDKNSYKTYLKDEIILDKGGSYTINRTESFTFTDDEYKSEQFKISSIQNNPERYFSENLIRWQSYINNTIKDDGSVSKAYKNAAIKSIMTLTTNWRSEAGDLKNSGITPSVSYRWFNGLWAWDSWKNAVAVAGFDTELAKDSIRVMFDYQVQSTDEKRPQDEGVILDAIYYQEESFNKRNSKPPLAAWAVYNVYKEDKDIEFVKEMYPKLKAYHEWWYRNRDTDKNGIAEYGAMVHEAHYKYDSNGNILKDESNTPILNNDAIIEAAAWESGMDNAIRFDKEGIGEGDIGVQVFKNTNKNGDIVGYSINQESVDLNAYLYAEKAFLKYFAELLGNNEDAVKYKNEAKEVADYINKFMYDDETGFYYDLQIDKTGNNKKLLVNRGKGTEGYIPLWAKLAPSDKAEKVVQNILDPEKFNLNVPFPTASKDNPFFNPNVYWRGPVWLDQALYGIEALENYGYKKEAIELTYKLFDNAQGILSSNPINENYNPLTGEALHAKNFSWSAAAYYLLYRNTLCGNENTSQNVLTIE